MKPISEGRQTRNRSWFWLQGESGAGPPLRRYVILAGLLISILSTTQAQNPIIYLGASPGSPAQCNCLNNSTQAGNGQFGETVSVNSDPGESWSVSAITGLYSTGSPPPPASPVPIGVGVTLTETSPGVYQLSGKHVDGAGFSISVTNGSETLTIANACYYPHPQIVGLPSELCKTSLPVPLVGNAGGVQGNSMFQIDGQLATVFNPQLLTPGLHTVTYTFDAGTGTPNTANDPGCSASVSQSVFLYPEPNLVTNFQVNVPLNSQCKATIVPNMILEGDYPCINDDYVVTIFNQQGQPIGNMVTGEHAGQLLMVQVSSLGGGYTGVGSILVLDLLPPSIECTDNDGQGWVNQQVQFLRDTLNNTDPNFLPTNFACLANQVNPSANLHFYELTTFSVSQTDVYTFELSTPFGFGAALLYPGNFNPIAGPCQNFMASAVHVDPGQGYFTNQNNIVRLTAPLQAGQTYTLLTTSAVAGSTGPFTWAVYSSGPGLIANTPAINAQVAQPLFCSDYQALLNNPANLAITGQPNVTDNCSNTNLTFQDVLLGIPECADVIINRTFTVSDGSGNQDQCTQAIHLKQLTFSDMTLPPKNVLLDCSGSFATLPSGNPHPSVTGYPLVQSAFGTFYLNPVYCNLLATYSDQPKANTCDGSYQFVRRWFIIDNCSVSSTIQYDQFIRVSDITPPTVVCPNPDVNMDGQPDTIYYNTGNNDCTTAFLAPLPIVSDNCSSWEVLTEIITTSGNQTQVLTTIQPGADRTVFGIPVGCHQFRFKVTDDCGNMTTLLCPFCVRDPVEPVAVCDDNITVVLNNNGYGSISAADVDEGSTDNCGVSKMEVRRMISQNPGSCTPVVPYFTNWGPSVEFSCCDVSNLVPVQLRITDVYGNANSCETLITVKDKTIPVCVAPNPVVTNCQDLPPDFDPTDLGQLSQLFGSFSALDVCGVQSSGELTPVATLNNCGAGTILRRFQAVDVNGNASPVCQQTISIIKAYDYQIRFPKDASMVCGTPIPDTLIVAGSACDNFAINVEEQTFSVNGGPCYKLVRTFHIINWCEYDGYSEPVTLGRDEDCDNNGGDEDLWVIVNSQGAFLDRDNQLGNNQPPANARGNFCNLGPNPAGYWRQIPSVGYWIYSQTIMVTDDTDPLVQFSPTQPFCSVDNQQCLGTVTIPFTVTETCSPNGVTVKVFRDLNADGILDGEVTASALTGSYPNYTASGNFPLGNHAYQVRVTDGCGNQTVINKNFQVVDCAAPSPTCINGISVNLNPLLPGIDADGDGNVDAAAVSVSVQDMLAGAQPQDCSGPLQFSLHRTDEITSGADTPNPGQQGQIFTCDDIGTVIVRVYSWDSAVNPNLPQPGPNSSYCETYIIVQDNLGACQAQVTMGTVSGIIHTEQGVPVEGVHLQPMTSMPVMATTQDNGFYQIEDLESGHGYDVTPTMEADYKNGVTTLDLILVARHVLGSQHLGTPYQLIAADVNRSKTISTLDIIQLRKLILNITDVFPNSPSWCFIPESYHFPDLTNPWLEDFPESDSIPQLSGSMANRDFIAVKIGDVNGSVQANALAVENRSGPSETCYLNVEEKQVDAGEWFTAEFTATAPELIAGFQYTLEFDPDEAELVGILHGLVRDEHVNRQAEQDGQISFSWDTQEPGWAIGEEVVTEALFALRMRAKKALRLSELLKIRSRPVFAEAYTVSDERMNLDLQFTGKEVEADGYELFQNRPNPFTDESIIDFTMPEDASARISIFDVSGKLRWKTEGRFAKGYNRIAVKAADLGQAQGVLYYKLETGSFTATRKMMLIAH